MAFLCNLPGIRPAGSEIGDQKRVMTPQEAHQIGSDYIVIGHPIIQAEILPRVALCEVKT